MRVAVTGANGFVGWALVARLRAGGHEAVPIVRAPSGLADERVAGEIDGATDWSGPLAGVDALVHLAARVHVMRDRAGDPLAAFRKVNRDGTENLARQAAAQGVRRFVLVSSVKVNGEASAPGRPFRADDPPAPEDAYGISKMEAEAALAAAAHGSRMDYVIVRPPLVYGPGAGGNFRSMAKWVRRGMPLPLGAATGNRRSLVGIDNLVDLIVCVLDHPAAAGQIFMAGDGEDVSTADLLRRIGKAGGRRTRLLPVPTFLLRGAARLLGRGAVADRLFGDLQVDIAKTRERLGWTPPVPLDEGLRRALGPVR